MKLPFVVIQSKDEKTNKRVDWQSDWHAHRYVQHDRLHASKQANKPSFERFMSGVKKPNFDFKESRHFTNDCWTNTSNFFKPMSVLNNLWNSQIVSLSRTWQSDYVVHNGMCSCYQCIQDWKNEKDSRESFPFFLLLFAFTFAYFFLWNNMLCPRNTIHCM